MSITDAQDPVGMPYGDMLIWRSGGAQG